MPALRKVAGGAMVALRLETSSGVISGRSMSTRKGSPSADWTVTRPRANACASNDGTLNKAAVANATAVACQRREGLVVEVPTARSAGSFVLFMRTVAFRRKLLK